MHAAKVKKGVYVRFYLLATVVVVLSTVIAGYVVLLFGGLFIHDQFTLGLWTGAAMGGAFIYNVWGLVGVLEKRWLVGDA